jgi:hypothetical protein
MPLQKDLTKDELDSLVARAEDLIGFPLAELLRRHRQGMKSKTPPIRPHRLIILFERLRESLEAGANPIMDGAVAVNAAELDTALNLFDEWRDAQAWPEFQKALQDPSNYLHAVGALAVASTLKEKHAAVALQASRADARSADLLMTVTDKLELNLEVKAPSALWQPRVSLSVGHALAIVRSSLRSAGLGSSGQLAAGRPAILAIAGMFLSDESFNLMTRAMAATLLSSGRRWPHLLGIALFNLRQRIEVSGERVHILLEHESTLRRNRHYSGGLTINGDWAGPWRLEEH